MCNFVAKLENVPIMRNAILAVVLGWFLGLSAVCLAQCPFFSTPMYPSLSYNIDATPWNLELEVFGDTTGATIAWYRYLRNTQTAADAVLYTGPGSNTVSECMPETSPAMRNTHYNYFCVLKTPACPGGITSAEFDVQVAIGNDCWTMDGTSFTIQTAPNTYDEDGEIKLTAYYSGYGGFHYYTWFLNGDTVKEDANHIILNDPDNFNYSVLTIKNAKLEDAGAYSVSVKDGPGCEKKTSVKTITVNPKVYDYMVFDDKNGTHVWSDPKNWWPSYSKVPMLTDSVFVRKRCNVDVANAQVGNLTIDMTGDTALVITPQGALLIAKHLYGCKAGDLLVQADATGNGALVMAAGNTSVPATVRFYARSEQMNAATPVWQYIGYPMTDKPSLADVYTGAELYEWTNTPNLHLGGNWQKMDPATQNAAPFTGYCMTQTDKQTYSFSGTLNNPATQSISVPYNDQGIYPGFALLANSWVAPISIAAMTTADFGAADATVYIMNTGTYNEAVEQQPKMAIGSGIDPGQYNAIPVHAASYVAGGLTVIPPMQGFFVHTTAATTIKLNYEDAVYTPALTSVTTTPTRAPQQIRNQKSEIRNVESTIRLHVEGFGSSDDLYLLADNRFTASFDNGWDGRKAYGRSPLSIAALSGGDALAVAAVSELEGLPIEIQGGLDKYYTITVTLANNPSPLANNLYLLDKETGVYTPLTDGAEYIYTITDNADRLSIVRKASAEELQGSSATKFMRGGHLYIRVDNKLYDASGRKIE